MPRTNVAVRAPLLVILAAVALVTAMLAPLSVRASSHREAPLISRDPTADNTDLYAFRSPDGPNSVTIVANYIPLEEPAGGPNFNAFDDNVLYEVKVDNTGDARDDVTYQFRFKTTYADSDLFGPSFLFNDFTIDSVNDATCAAPVLHRPARGGQHLQAARLGHGPAHQHRSALDPQL